VDDGALTGNCTPCAHGKSRTRDRWAEDYRMYVLVGDSRGNRLPGATAAPNGLRRGQGDTLDAIAEELSHLPE
jgi:hypothetical protein